MMAALWAWALANPALASVLLLVLWFAAGLLVTLLFIARRLPYDDGNPLDPVSLPAPTPQPWARSGGNWWPNP